MTKRAIVAFVDYIKEELKALAEDTHYEGKPYELLIALIQEGKTDLKD